MPAALLLLAPTSLFDLKMCCPAGLLLDPKVVGFTCAWSSRGSASHACPRLPSFGLPSGTVSSLRSSSRCSTSSICFPFRGSTLGPRPRLVGPLCGSISHLPCSSGSGLHSPFCSGALTSRSPSRSVGMSTLRSALPCSGVSSPRPASPYAFGSKRLGPCGGGSLSPACGLDADGTLGQAWCNTPLVYARQPRGFDFTRVRNCD